MYPQPLNNPLDIVTEVQQLIPKKFNNINNGGCAYFARFFYEEFKKLKLGVQLEIKGLKSFWCGGYQHIYLTINGEPFDAQNWMKHELAAYRASAIDHLDYRRLKEIAKINDFGTWNSEFGGAAERKQLRKEIQAFFQVKREALKTT